MLSRRVVVPSVGIPFPSGEAIWIIAALGFCLLTLIRNRLGFVFLDPNLARGEPWIVTDIGVGAERWLAGAWLFAIFASSWVITGSLMTVVTSQIYMDGFASWKPVWSALLLIASGWMALTTAGHLLSLRYLRAGGASENGGGRRRSGRRKPTKAE